jgi:hypothetical protein
MCLLSRRLLKAKRGSTRRSTEVGAEQNTMTIVMMPSEFVSMAAAIAKAAAAKG